MHETRLPVSLYLLRTPSYKFALRIGFNVVLIISQQITNPAELKKDGNEREWYIMLLWAMSGCLAEYTQFAPSLEALRYELLSFVRDDSPSLYRR